MLHSIRGHLSQWISACIVLDKRIIELPSKLYIFASYHVFIHCTYVGVKVVLLSLEVCNNPLLIFWRALSC